MSRADAQGRQMPNKHEHALMLDLMMLRNSLAHHDEAVRQRLACYPYAWRDMRLLWHLVNKLQNQLLDTMPDRRVAYYDQMARQGQVIIDIPGPIPRGRHEEIEQLPEFAVVWEEWRGWAPEYRENALEIAPVARMGNGLAGNGITTIILPEMMDGDEEGQSRWWTALPTQEQREETPWQTNSTAEQSPTA